MMIFCATCNGTMKIALMLRNLGYTAIPLNGQMSQNKRLSALTKFKAKNRSLLVSTDVASRYQFFLKFSFKYLPGFYFIKPILNFHFISFKYKI